MGGVNFYKGVIKYKLLLGDVIYLIMVEIIDWVL